jgi:hypothetical protein
MARSTQKKNCLVKPTAPDDGVRSETGAVSKKVRA